MLKVSAWQKSTNAADSFVNQYAEEFNTLKKERRAGRPASTREDLLKIKIAQDEKEFKDGFCLCSNLQRFTNHTDC